MSEGKAIVGVDVGGTFTDLFLFDAATRRFSTAKVPSNRGNEAAGFMQGLEGLGDISSFDSVVHGTTVGTNMLLERRGPRIGVITTRGFRDVLEMRRRDRRQTWGLWGEFVPIADRDLRVEVDERTLADGSVRTAVDPAAVARAAEELKARGAQALAIIFINAYANAENERRALEAARAVWPNEHVSASHQVLPEIREFERASTTALNAYLQPGVGAYIARLENALAEKNFAGTFHIVQSNGGVMSTATARRLPVRTALSGPAAGVIAAAAIARATGYDDIITGDLGGTSFDVSLVAGGKASLAAQTTIDFGMVIRTPMIEITTIGAGGGSIAWVDRGGLLQVGPESAGSVPGPACYGQGNERPTLTDAHVVLGRINAARPIGKLAQLDVEAARRAISKHVAEPLHLDVMQAAEAIVRVADARMAGAIRLVSIERGHDPAKFAAMPFGGGGALHVGALIKEIGLRCAVVPRFPGVTSALGCVIADLRHDQVQTLNLNVDGLDVAALDSRMAEAGHEAKAVVEAAGIAVERIDVVFELDMHYLGQTHTVAVPLPVTLGAKGTGITEAAIRKAFDETYQAAFGRLLPGIPTRIVSLRTAAIGRRPAFDLSAFAPPADASLATAAKGTRKVWFADAWHDAKVWSRLDLPVGAEIEAPAVLEQADATIFIEPGLKASVDRLGNVIVERA